MPAETILVVDDAQEIRDFLADSVLRPNGYQVLTAESGLAALQIVRNALPDLIITDFKMPDLSGIELARSVRREHPELPILLITAEGSEEIARQALRAGVRDYFIKPFDPDELLRAVQTSLTLTRTRREQSRTQLELAKQNEALSRRLKELETLTSVGHDVVSVLHLDQVLLKVVEAAVQLTGAEEGSLMLLDEGTEELTIRAAKNFDDQFVRAFRLKSEDSLAGQVLRSGEPMLLREGEPQKIVTAYLVHSLAYVPLRVRDRRIGVLGVDNRTARAQFTDHDLRLLQALGDYAAIAIENARLFLAAEAESKQIYAIVNETEDGVIVVDERDKVVLMNGAARALFGVERVDVVSQPLREAIPHPDLHLLLMSHKHFGEIALSDGRFFNANITRIESVGRVIVLREITYLKELDRIKSEFVTTVSHDLRSPLTAILGYVSLIDRAGPINDRQAEFIEQIRASVGAMNDLLSDLLDLGRIEAGFDAQKEVIAVGPLAQSVADSYYLQARGNQQYLHIRIAPDLPRVLANASRLRQMLSNLLENALKYTPAGGNVGLEAYIEGDFVVLAVTDTGIGIPAADQPYVFDKFFRASNARENHSGTGLGLSIVKSIVDNHEGRIWMDSKPGEGTTFTVMLPKYREA
jgi:two-component system NtrC family sensor kinase